MRRLALILVLAVSPLPGLALAQTYGHAPHPRHPQAHSPHGPAAHGQAPYGHPGLAQGAAYGDPRAYRAPPHSHRDRGGRYGYSPASGQWTRWSSPPGRGYHDVYGYNDDRAPRTTDRAPDRTRQTGCNCGYGPYLRDQ